MLFAQDLKPNRLLHAKLVLSPFASARVRSITDAAALQVPGVVAVVVAADLPSLQVAGPDLPLAGERVYYAGQPLAAVLAESEGAAADGAAALEVDLEPLPAVTDPGAAMRAEAPLVLDEQAEGFDDATVHGGAEGGQADTEPRPRNVSTVRRAGWGDVAAGLAEADEVIAASYEMAGVHQGFLEPHVVVAAPEGGGVAIWTPTQGPFKVRDDVARLLGLPASAVRVTPMQVGGGFGGKIILLEPLAAVLALRARRPVRIALSRSEEFLVGRPAPASRTDVRLGARRDGTLTALEVAMVWDNGAASGWHSAVSATLLGQAYRLPNFAFKALEVSTHKTPVEAYRGPGGTQAYFALESALDELAGRLGMDPIELRLRNAPVSDGAPRPGVVECLQAARAHPAYTEPARPGEGVGVALGAWIGPSNPAAAYCRVEADGSLNLQLGSADISGSATALAIVAAETFGVPVDRVTVRQADTTIAPEAPVAGGSQTVYSGSPAVAQAAAEARRQVLELASEHLEAAPEDLRIEAGEVLVRGVPGRRVTLAEVLGSRPHAPVLGVGRTRLEGRGPAFTVHVCRVVADAETGAWRVARYAAFQDVGRAINPPEIEGQVHGGALQGMGRVLGEQLVYDNEGQLRTGTFIDYELPAIDQAPDFEVTLLEVPSEHPLGVRGVGEPPAIPGPAAIVNALSAAAGVRVRRLPVDWTDLVAARPA